MSTFVLVHGGWSGGWYWEKSVPLLEVAGHRVEAPNLLGSGDDRTPIPEVSLQGYADRIAGVLDAHPEPAVLVGQSMGGMVISQAAEQRPDEVETLVYVGAYLSRVGEAVLSAAENGTESLILANLVMSEDGSSATPSGRKPSGKPCSPTARTKTWSGRRPGSSPRPWPRSPRRLPSPKRTSAGYRGCTSELSGTGPSARGYRGGCTSGCPARRSSP